MSEIISHKDNSMLHLGGIVRLESLMVLKTSLVLGISKV